MERFDNLITGKLVESGELPIKYKVFDDFFAPNVYSAFCAVFNKKLAAGLRDVHATHAFSKSDAKSSLTDKETYDAYIVPLTTAFQFPINFIFSIEFFDFFSKLFQVEFTQDLMVSLHHHKIGSKSGYLHTDYEVVNFIREPLPTGINVCNLKVRYQGTRTVGPDVSNVCRSVALLYYFNNEEWQAGDGGETGFFKAGVAEPYAKVAPKNNRMMAFEISPQSFHAFISNTRIPRNCFAFWFHSEIDYQVKKYKTFPMGY